jgi:hypothetical protein
LEKEIKTVPVANAPNNKPCIVLNICPRITPRTSDIKLVRARKDKTIGMLTDQICRWPIAAPAVSIV